MHHNWGDNQFQGSGWKGVFLLVLALTIFVWILKAEVGAWYLTSKLRVPVSISNISVWPSEMLIRKFRIKNPSGFQTKTAFEAGTAQISYEFKHLFTGPLILDEIYIDKIFLSIEFSDALGTKNNWMQIGAGMPKERSHRQVLIHKLVLSNLTVEIGGLGLSGQPATSHIDRIELSEINSAKGFPTSELISQIFQSAGLENYIEDAFKPHGVLDELFNPLGQL